MKHTKAPSPAWAHLDPVNLVSFDDGIRLGNGVACHSLIIKGAIMLVGVAMARAEDITASTLEASEADTFVTGEAPVGFFWGRYT